MRINGYIRWINGDAGIVEDFDGNQYFGNEWSFEDTVYIVTGICKVTGLEKTIETRHFPGLFLNYKVKQGSTYESVQHKYHVPCTFEQADGIDQPWAVKITLAPELQEQVDDMLIESALDAMLACDLGHEKYQGWRANAEKKLERLLGGAE